MMFSMYDLMDLYYYCRSLKKQNYKKTYYDYKKIRIKKQVKNVYKFDRFYKNFSTPKEKSNTFKKVLTNKLSYDII